MTNEEEENENCPIFERISGEKRFIMIV